MDNKQKLLVAMSGGVDSSVAAALVKQQGFDVTGITMRIWDGQETPGQVKHHGCYGPGETEDIEDASRVAQTLDIPFKVIDLTREYKSVVLDYFNQEYSSGRTPNPCIRCNHRMKFGILIEKAREIGLDFDFIASGHYARIEPAKDRFLLKKAADLSKDQSYFLSFLSQEQLAHLRFPLGDITKAEVRRIAFQLGLSVADKPDSQNFICGDYSAVFGSNPNPGPIMDQEGKLLGRHQGIRNYTIGQRKGLGIATPEPIYVTSIDSTRNAIIVGSKTDIYRQEFKVSNLNWIGIPYLKAPTVFDVKVRSSHQGAKAEVSPANGETATVRFVEPQLAITPGQAAVFYDKDVVTGAGIIEKVES